MIKLDKDTKCYGCAKSLKEGTFVYPAFDGSNFCGKSCFDWYKESLVDEYIVVRDYGYTSVMKELEIEYNELSCDSISKEAKKTEKLRIIKDDRDNAQHQAGS